MMLPNKLDKILRILSSAINVLAIGLLIYEVPAVVIIVIIILVALSNFADGVVSGQLKKNKQQNDGTK